MRCVTEKPRVAIVHDWLVTYGGAERVLEEIISLYPQAELFSLCDFIPEGDREFLQNKSVTTSFLQNLPGANKYYRNFLPLMPFAVEQFDLSAYDLVISSSHAVAKGVITGPDQHHICYCHSPVRYAWDLTHQYLRESGMTSGLKSWIVRYLLHRLRMWDYRTANGVDQFVANSEFIARRIRKVYGRSSIVIHPPVNCDAFDLCLDKEEFYLTASRMVPYKKMDLIVEAFSSMPNKKLVVIGDGPDFNKIKNKAAPNVQIMGYQSFDVLRDHMRRAQAFVFAAEEDFGIVPVEAQACGTPVIAFGKGGALETVIENKTGMFFWEQKVDALIEAVNRFEELRVALDPEIIRQNALRFSVSSFKTQFAAAVSSMMSNGESGTLSSSSSRISVRDLIGEPPNPPTQIKSSGKREVFAHQVGNHFPNTF